ncbi:MAG: polyphenol oxidase family protein [Chthoniobacterales bacterium]|nr:polyphenol oxidase family protein [Chthoniobacterales bacterium]
MAVKEPEFRPLSSVAGLRAAFIPRVAGVDVATDRTTALARLRMPHEDCLRQLGFDPLRLATAEQVHGDVTAEALAPRAHAGADALITNVPGLVLGIYVADCAAVYLADRVGRAIGLVHSGRAGTELNITGSTIRMMQQTYGIEPRDLVVHVSPCIRPPLYETDFASAIVSQARAAGAVDVFDDGICTGSNTGTYYSYRVEQGKTGRMLAVLALEL